MVKLKQIVNVLEEIAPPFLADEWDNIGLQVGDYDSDINNILISLDLTEQVFQEARQLEADLILCHHPLIFKPLKNIIYSTKEGNLIKSLISSNINLYVAHTNLDKTKGGVNDALLQTLGLKNIGILNPEYSEKLYKLVVFLPAGFEDQIREAMSEAGAGFIGNYSECAFQSKGFGTFKPEEGTHPYLGKQGCLEKVEEIRLETIVPEKHLNAVIEQMIASHPYEEVAYDVYLLQNRGKSFGLGNIGLLNSSISFREFLKLVKDSLGLNTLRFGGDLDKMITKVAVCGGAGSFLSDQAVQQGADVYLTSDIKYHDAQNMLNKGLNFIDAGHFATENTIVNLLKLKLELLFQERNFKLNVYQTKLHQDIFNYI